MKILVVSSGSAETRTTWSGVPNRIVCELRNRGVNVECVDCEDVLWIKILSVLFNRVIRRIIDGMGWRMFCSMPFGIWAYSKWLRKITNHKQYDLDRKSVV